MDGAFISAEEVPSEYKVVDEVTHNPAGHAHVASVDAKGDVDDTKDFDFASVNANGAPWNWANGAIVEGGMATKKTFTDACPFTTGVAKGRLLFVFDFN